MKKMREAERRFTKSSQITFDPGTGEIWSVLATGLNERRVSQIFFSAGNPRMFFVDLKKERGRE